MVEVGGDLREMAKAGRIPTNERTATGFWFYQFHWAVANEDVEVAENCLAALKKLARQNPRFQRTIPRLEQALKTLKEKK